jgi:plasmid stabilization system protein ParE
VRLEFSPRAAGEADRCGRWWREHRSAARTLFEEELRRALDQIPSAPHLGSSFKAKSGREYRRVLMPVTRHHVYYSLIAPDCVRVHSVWSAVRRSGPVL